MDFEIEELDNFFSEHFRWTPNSTSQVADHEDSSEDDGPADDPIDLDRRVMQFLDDSDDENGDIVHRECNSTQ